MLDIEPPTYLIPFLFEKSATYFGEPRTPIPSLIPPRLVARPDIYIRRVFIEAPAPHFAYVLKSSGSAGTATCPLANPDQSQLETGWSGVACCGHSQVPSLSWADGCSHWQQERQNVG